MISVYLLIDYEKNNLSYEKIHKLSKIVSPFFEKELYFCSGDSNVNDTTKKMPHFVSPEIQLK